MFRISSLATLQSWTARGVVTAALLAAPAVADAQTSRGERALLNHIALASLPAGIARSAATPGGTGAVSGERALLTRFSASTKLQPAGPGAVPATWAAPLDGARALLGHWRAGDGAAFRATLVGEHRVEPTSHCVEGARP